MHPYLQRLEGVREGLHPDQEGGNDDGGGVVGAVVAASSQVPCKAAAMLGWQRPDTSQVWTERRERKPLTFPLCVLNLLISLDEHLPPPLRLRSHGLGQVAESVGVGQVQGLSQGWRWQDQSCWHAATTKRGETWLCAGDEPLTGSRREPKGRLDTASGHCTSYQPACWGASSTQSYWFPLSGGETRDTKQK